MDADGYVTDTYGIDSLPAVVIFDAGGNVVYKGSIDDDPMGSRPPEERTHFVAGALAAVANGVLPDPVMTPTFGCPVR